MVSVYILCLAALSLAFIPVAQLCIKSVEVPPDMSLHQLTQLTHRLVILGIALGAYTSTAIMLITAYLYLGELNSKRTGKRREVGDPKDAAHEQ